MAREATLVQNLENAVQLTWTNATGSDKNVGDPVAIKTTTGKRLAAVVLGNEDHQSGDVANGETGQVLIRGRVKVAKNTSTAFTQGATVWWDQSETQADSSTNCGTMDDFVLGMCTEAAATSATHVELDLNEGPDNGSLGSSSSSSSSSSE